VKQADVQLVVLTFPVTETSIALEQKNLSALQ
jgi:hypothetical protein